MKNQITDTSKKDSLFSMIKKTLQMDSYFIQGFPAYLMPKIIFLTALTLLYISNSHYADITTRKINQAEIQVEDLRADYTTQKAEIMLASKQSEVAKRVKAFGLEKSSQPPYKIIHPK